METYDDYWEIVNSRGISDGVHKWYEVQLMFNNSEAVRAVERLEITVERLEGHIFVQEKEISRLKSMNLFQRIFRWRNNEI